MNSAVYPVASAAFSGVGRHHWHCAASADATHNDPLTTNVRIDSRLKNAVWVNGRVIEVLVQANTPLGRGCAVSHRSKALRILVDQKASLAEAEQKLVTSLKALLDQVYCSSGREGQRDLAQ